MKKSLWIGIPLLVLAMLIGWRFQTNKQAEAELGPGGGQRRGGSVVELAVAGSKTIVTSLSAVGSAESPFRVEISPKAAGRIEYLALREGDPVRRGEVLARIDPSEQQALVLQQQANVAEARSRLAQAQLGQGASETGVETAIEQRQAELNSAKADFSQVQRNYDAMVASADADVTDAEAQMRSAESKEKNAQAELNRQNANLKNSKTKLDRAESLYKEGYVSLQAVEDARTANEVQLANVEVAKGQLNAATNDVTSANAQLQSSRNGAAIARRKGQADISSAKANVDKAASALKAAQANRSQNPAYRQNLAALQAGVRAAEAQLAQARARLNDLELRSPIDGTVTKRNGDPGSMASPGSALLEVQSLDWLYVSCSLPMDDAGKVKTGQEAQVTFDALPERSFTARISQINLAADPQSRQFGILLRLENPRHIVKPGMFGRVSIAITRTEAEVVIPREAVKTDSEGKSTVTVVGKDNKAETREVELGVNDSAGVQILKGVAAGERVVKLSYQPVRDGQEVKTSEPAEARNGGKGR